MNAAAPPTLDFGTAVLVRAETVRVICNPDVNGHTWRQATPLRDYGRFVHHDFAAFDDWPGDPIERDWEPHSRTFDPSPTPNGRPLVRLRRIVFPAPPSGIVVGATRRQEGVLVASQGEITQLAGPGRTIDLLEVALPPARSGKARLILAHRFDVAAITP